MAEDRLFAYRFLQEKAASHPWAKRILAELGFLLEVSGVQGNSLDGQLLPVVEALRDAFLENGAICKEDALRAEEALSPLAPEAKKYQITCVAHAHIDMNWKWAFQETASVTVDTFRTMLKLMEEYPAFRFSQSQASVYRIVEEYYPAMLEEIRRRVGEGRWEVTASSWVENDKNMAGGEAMARHLLYTKRYLHELLGISEDAVLVDFEPDTFGHAENLPEVLRNGGVRYYYHCRGKDDGCCVYNWEAPSGARVLVWNDPAFYNEPLDWDRFFSVPRFCQAQHTNQFLRVYGVGDHGGGPTRRDLDRLLEMAQWPIFPANRMGTLGEFFQNLEKDRDRFPTVTGDLNYVFTGCYTSQARIKRGNRMGEDRLFESEALDVMAGSLDPAYRTASPFEIPWRRVLFNQFHDILPGSGVADTREYAMGEYQKAMAATGINASHAMEAICARIDTSFLKKEAFESLSEGAGGGYGTSAESGYRFPAMERGCGNVRAYALFNTLPYARDAVVDLTVWDWPDDPSLMGAFDAEGRPLELQLLEDGDMFYGHHFTKVAVPVSLPATGYSTVVLRTLPAKEVRQPVWIVPRVDRVTDEPIVLENEKLRAVFSPETMQILSLVRKDVAREYVDSARPAGSFRLVTEAYAGLTAWRVGRYARVENLNQNCPVQVTSVEAGPLRKSVGFTILFRSSRISGRVSLDVGSDVLRYDLTVDWNEQGTMETGVLQLNFDLPLAEKNGISRCAVPFGVQDRPALAQDVPCVGMIAGATEGDTVALLSDCKYGFRNSGEGLGVTLIRSSFDPDPKPEIAVHTIGLGVALVDGSPDDLLACNERFSHPAHVCSVELHAGDLPLSLGLLEVSGCRVSGVKRAEEGDRLIVRLYNPNGEERAARLTFAKNLLAGEKVTFLERSLGQSCSVGGRVLETSLKGHQVATLAIRFQGDAAVAR